MITEFVTITIKPGTDDAFKTAIAKAAPLFEGAKGCIGLTLFPIIETKGKYALHIKWETLENHMVDFRQSEAYTQWRDLVGGYFAEPPHVEHGEPAINVF